MGGGQQQRPNFGLQFQNQLASQANQNSVGMDFSWQAAAQLNRANVIKTLYVLLTGPFSRIYTNSCHSENRLKSFCEQNAQYFAPPAPQVDLQVTARKIEEQSWQGATSQVSVPLPHGPLADT